MVELAWDDRGTALRGVRHPRASRWLSLLVERTRRRRRRQGTPRERGRADGIGVWTPEVRGRPGGPGTTAGRRDAAAGTPGCHGGCPCSSEGRKGDGGIRGRRESAAEPTDEGSWRLRSRGGRAGLGQPRDGAMRRQAPPGVTAAVPARRQGATATAVSRDAGRERGGRSEGRAKGAPTRGANRVVRSDPGTAGRGRAVTEAARPARRDGATTRGASRVGGGAVWTRRRAGVRMRRGAPW